MSVAEEDRRPRVHDRRRKRFFFVDNVIVDEYAEQEGMDAYALALYMVLARMASNDKGAARPYNRTLQRKIGAGKTTVCKALNTLEQAGLIERVPHFNEKGSHIANDYVLLEVNPNLREETLVRHTNEGGSPHERGSESRTPRFPDTYADSLPSSNGEEYSLEENGEIGVGPDGQTVADGLTPNKPDSQHTGGPDPAPGVDHADSVDGLPRSAPTPSSATPLPRSWWQYYKACLEERGMKPSDRDPQIIGANLGKLAKREDVTEAEMHKVVDNLLSLAASGKQPGSPQQALKRVRGDTKDPDPYAHLVGVRVLGSKREEFKAAGRLGEDGTILPPPRRREEATA